MKAYLAEIALALLLLCGGLGLALRHSYRANGELVTQVSSLEQAAKTAQEQRKRDQALLARRAKQNAAAARETASLRLKLDTALSLHRDWADQPVPKEVQDALAQ